MNITGKTMLITGASQGIGRYCAGFFAKRGVEVILAARREDVLRKASDEIVAAGGRCSAFPLDLADSSAIARFADTLCNQGKAVDILFNNAADLTSKPLLESSLEEIDRLIRTNVTGTLQLCRAIAPFMVAKRSGTIINMSSLAGYKCNPAQTAYSVSKRAVNGISDALRTELAPSGINVMNVAVPSVWVDAPQHTGQIPVAEFAQRLADAIERDETELYFSAVTKWLMRLYAFYPALARLR